MIYTLSLHDALPISRWARSRVGRIFSRRFGPLIVSQMASAVRSAASSERSAYRWKYDSGSLKAVARRRRSEEHTSELQSRQYLVCRLLLEKKKVSGVGLGCHQHDVRRETAVLERRALDECILHGLEDGTLARLIGRRAYGPRRVVKLTSHR